MPFHMLKGSLLSYCGTPRWLIVNLLGHLVLVPKSYSISDGGGRDVLMQSYFCCTCMYILWRYVYIFVSFLLYPCISGGKSTMIRFCHGTIHFPKMHWLGRTSRRWSACRPSAVGTVKLIVQAPRVVGGVPSWRSSVRTSVSVMKITTYCEQWVKTKELYFCRYVRENPLLRKPAKCNAWNLSYWTGGRDTAQNLFMVEKPTMNIVLWIHGITVLNSWELTLYMV